MCDPKRKSAAIADAYKEVRNIFVHSNELYKHNTTSSINIASSIHPSNTIAQCSHSWPIKNNPSVQGTNFDSWFSIQILKYDGIVG